MAGRASHGAGDVVGIGFVRHLDAVLGDGRRVEPGGACTIAGWISMLRIGMATGRSAATRLDGRTEGLRARECEGQEGRGPGVVGGVVRRQEVHRPLDRTRVSLQLQ